MSDGSGTTCAVDSTSVSSDVHMVNETYVQAHGQLPLFCRATWQVSWTGQNDSGQPAFAAPTILWPVLSLASACTVFSDMQIRQMMILWTWLVNEGSGLVK